MPVRFSGCIFCICFPQSKEQFGCRDWINASLYLNIVRYPISEGIWYITLSFLRDAKQELCFELLSSSFLWRHGVQAYISHTPKTPTGSWCCCIDLMRVYREKLFLENCLGSSFSHQQNHTGSTECLQ